MSFPENDACHAPKSMIFRSNFQAQKCPKFKKIDSNWQLFEPKLWISFWALCLISKRSHLKWTWMKGKWVLISKRKDSFGLESDWLNWFQFSHKPCLVHDFSRRNNYQNIISETNASSWSLSHSDSSVKHEVKKCKFLKKITMGPYFFRTAHFHA